MKSIAIITPSAESIINFRASFIKKLCDSGYKVYALAPDYNKVIKKDEVANLGCIPIDIELNRASISPLLDFINTLKLIIILRKINPSITFSYSIKPVIFGSIASFLAGVPYSYSMIEGLGRVFAYSERKTIKKSLIKKVVILMYKFSLKISKKVIFLNNDDIFDFISYGVISRDKAILLGGIGVDLNYWTSSNEVVKRNETKFIYTSRLMEEKGILEYIKSAYILKEKYPDCTFYVLGDCDSEDCNEVINSTLKEADAEGVINWVGHTRNVKNWFNKSNVFVLPSYYREGIPRSTQEAMSMSMPIITCDTPGNKETVVDGLNGFFTPPKDSKKLALTMAKFINNPDLIGKMGNASRKIAIEIFDEKIANKILLDIMLDNKLD
jgi:glycosyltransferase involved in cell wall biosynthesis